MIKFVFQVDLPLILKDYSTTTFNVDFDLISTSKAGYMALLRHNVVHVISLDGKELWRLELPEAKYVALAASQSSKEEVVLITKDLRILLVTPGGYKEYDLGLERRKVLRAIYSGKTLALNSPRDLS